MDFLLPYTNLYFYLQYKSTRIYLLPILMRSFLKKILFFIFPLFIFVIMMDLYLVNMNSLYKEKVSGLLDHANEIEILILEFIYFQF